MALNWYKLADFQAPVESPYLTATKIVANNPHIIDMTQYAIPMIWVYEPTTQKFVIGNRYAIYGQPPGTESSHGWMMMDLLNIKFDSLKQKTGEWAADAFFLDYPMPRGHLSWNDNSILYYPNGMWTNVSSDQSEAAAKSLLGVFVEAGLDYFKDVHAWGMTPGTVVWSGKTASMDWMLDYELKKTARVDVINIAPPDPHIVDLTEGWGLGGGNMMDRRMRDEGLWVCYDGKYYIGHREHGGHGIMMATVFPNGQYGDEYFFSPPGNEMTRGVIRYDNNSDGVIISYYSFGDWTDMPTEDSEYDATVLANIYKANNIPARVLSWKELGY